MGSLWSGRECSVSSIWWPTTHHQPVTSRMVILVFCMIALLPHVSKAEEQQALQSSRDDGPKKYRYAEINVSYNHPDTKKEITIHYQGKYGVKSLYKQVLGVVVHVVSKSKPNSKSSKTNHSGCTQYVNDKIPKTSWIALVQRGDCPFTQKVKIATKVHNASAIVVYTNGDGRDDVMSHEALDSVSVFLNKDVKRIVDLLAKGIKIRMEIFPGTEFTMDDQMQHSISKTSVLFVSVSFIVLMVVSLAWLVFYYIQRFRYSHAKERLARLLVYAARKATAKIPQKTIKAGDKELEGDFDQCAVCIEQYKPHDVIRILPCRHVFHKSCIDPWLLDQRSCPMCKLDILRYYGMQVSGSQESVHRDPESGPVTQVVSEDPEVRFSVEDTRAEVMLVPPTWLHVHSDKDAEQEGDVLEEEGHAVASTSGAASDADLYPDDDATTLLPSSSTVGCSHNNVSRAQKRDKEDSAAETKALIFKGADGERQLSIDEEDDSVESADDTAGAIGHCTSPDCVTDDQDRSSPTDVTSSSWTGSSSSLHGLSRCTEIDVNVEVNHESNA